MALKLGEDLLLPFLSLNISQTNHPEQILLWGIFKVTAEIEPEVIEVFYLENW